jgi:outer membrane biosynthesis protein TonB
MMAQVYRRWQRPSDNVMLKAEVLFFIHRDGSVSDVQFVKRSGNFAFDLEAQGAIEATANAGAFGRLPEGFPADLLPVSFFFNPESMR